MPIKPVLEINPLIKEYKKKYIWGVEDENAIKIFIELCERQFRIDGFIDEENAGIRLFHRPVFSLKDINPEDSIILSLALPNTLKGFNVCTEICTLNHELHGKNVVVYGAGHMGQYLIPVLRSKGVNINGFIDSDEDKVGINICGIPVYGKRILQELPGETVVIEAGQYCNEIDRIVMQMNERLERFYMSALPCIRCRPKAIYVDRKNNTLLSLVHIAMLMELLGNREIILYGDDLSMAKKYEKILSCLDFEVSVMMCDKCRDANDVSIIDEVLHRDSYLILLYGRISFHSINKLYELGVQDNVRHIDFPFSERRRHLWDVNLGYTYEMNFKYPGICVHGNDRNGDYKIAVLGGSNTDSCFSSTIRSWVEILYDQYLPSNITIYNGGVCGYSSAEEIIKLIRDMMKLRPDMVLVYDGFNDLNLASTQKFAYLRKMIEYAGCHIRTSCPWDENTEKIWQGCVVERDTLDEWLDNIEYMNAIAKSRGVSFFAFMQPSLFTKKNLDLHSRELWINQSFVRMNLFQIFRARAKEIEKTHSYIYDLTNIFDDVDVYMDASHVYEEGNRIIADHIWDIIKDTIETNRINH